jgi:hypothetical protein
MYDTFTTLKVKSAFFRAFSVSYEKTAFKPVFISVCALCTFTAYDTQTDTNGHKKAQKAKPLQACICKGFIDFIGVEKQ